MTRFLMATALAGSLALAACAGMDGGAMSSGPSAAILAAVADPARPAADRERDAVRKPAELLAFAGVEPGDVVVDFLPGGGYFTRVLSKAVGSDGKVYAALPPPSPMTPGGPPDFTGYPNVTPVTLGMGGLSVPQPADVLWTAQNYHDMHLKALALDIAAVNRSFFNAVKPGGVFLVIDHSGAAGTTNTQADSLHRIEAATARKEIEAAGFVFEGESALLRNPADAMTINVFDPAIRGKTDQFVYKFRRPA